MTEEELKAALEQNNAELEAIKAKNAELLNEAKSAKEAKKLSDQAAETAKEEAARKSGDITKLEETLNAKFQTQLDEATKAKADAMSQLEKLTIENTITSELAKHQVLPAFSPALSAMFKANQFEISDGIAKIGDKALSEYISDFISSDDGKYYVQAPKNSGANASGSGDSVQSGFTKDSFNMTEQSKMRIADPALYKKTCESLGIKAVE